MPRGRPQVALATLALLAGLGCEEGGPPSAPEQRARAQRGVAPPDGPGPKQGPLRLAPPHRWTRLNPAGPPLYTPRPSPDGRWLAASGRGGVGLHVVEIAGPGAVLAVDPARRGPWAWLGGRAALRFGADAGARREWRPGRSVTPAGAGADPWERPWDEERGELLWQGPAGAWHHHPKRGTVTFTAPGAAPRAVAEHGAWGAVADSGGRFVAWSTGTLAESRLYAHDRARDETRSLGAGLHPAWLPGRGVVIYAVPAGVSRGPGGANVTGAELWVYDVRTGAQRALTATADRAEMEPAVAPAADAVFLADWQGGGIWRAPLLGGGAP